MLESIAQYKKIQKAYLDLDEADETKPTKPKARKAVPSREKSSNITAKKEVVKNPVKETKKPEKPEDNPGTPAALSPETKTQNVSEPAAVDSSVSDHSTDTTDKSEYLEVEDNELIKNHIKRLDRQAAENFRKMKQEEQLELIDKFIQTGPALGSKKAEEETTKEDQEDLSFHSTLFGDDLVTENLANIMIRQQNIEAAIDIYKKLIWKFPQKKGYFASQIKTLQEKINKGE